MRRTFLAPLSLALGAALSLPAGAQVSKETLGLISTPDKVETSIGTLEFKDGAPSNATLEKVYDHLDFTHAFEAFVNTLGRSTSWLRWMRTSSTSTAPGPIR